MTPLRDKGGVLERLNAGDIVIGDGGFVFALEKRGYVKAGPWTPEATVTHPEAVRQLHREFLRAGANVMQAFTFYASDDKLENRGQALKITGAQINEAACDLAREVANEGDALVAGGVSQTPSYLSCKSETEVKAIFKKQLDVFVKKNVDFLIAEVNSCTLGLCFNECSRISATNASRLLLLPYFTHLLIQKLTQ
uniref:Betaine-homocysteine methyltransferase n=1 Tax=Poecilia latipinna TaxID=48699 RepID=A0A3B3VPN3_9TELE